MSLLGYDYYQDKITDQSGLSRAASLIKAARAESPNSLLIDNVDLLQGNPNVKPVKDNGGGSALYELGRQLPTC